MKKRKKRITVPVIMQMETLECGAASLAMILAYHGKWLPLEQVRSDCGVIKRWKQSFQYCKSWKKLWARGKSASIWGRRSKRECYLSCNYPLEL